MDHPFTQFACRSTLRRARPSGHFEVLRCCNIVDVAIGQDAKSHTPTSTGWQRGEVLSPRSIKQANPTDNGNATTPHLAGNEVPNLDPDENLLPKPQDNNH